MFMVAQLEFTGLCFRMFTCLCGHMSKVEMVSPPPVGAADLLTVLCWVKLPLLPPSTLTGSVCCDRLQGSTTTVCPLFRLAEYRAWIVNTTHSESPIPTSVVFTALWRYLYPRRKRLVRMLRIVCTQ